MTSTVHCPVCGAKLPKAAAGGLCPRCLLQLGSAASDLLPEKTRFEQDSAADRPAQERFLPGTVLAGRFRIVARLGAGGMGEVYRADDLKLGQAVALKFLPERLQAEPSLLRRFLAEVKLARQIAHPHVCRVYDVGEIDGQHFLTMEYIDGEDLACLLKRIGRVPRDKAVQIALQICAGLAAIHAKGMLHRDIKPANVMLDGRGQVRITDFGVAGHTDGAAAREVCGTPEYMAPEQLAGQGATVKSDLYSLGLVLFETFTGQRVFDSMSLRLREQATPPDPALLVEGIDPAIGSLIHDCLQPDPDDRPNSAHAVLTVLPGGDPLQAMLMAGETPSPELVAATVQEDRPNRRLCAALMSLIVAGSLLIALAADESRLFRRAGLDKPPEALADRAYELLQSIGYTAPPHDAAYGFGNDVASLDHLTLDGDPARGDRLPTDRPAGMYFWYRQASAHLTPRNGMGQVNPWDPPIYTPGTTSVVLDPQARLLQLLAVPKQRDPGPDIATPAVWPQLFVAAGLDFDDFRPATLRWVPPVTCDTHLAWDGIYRDESSAIHVEVGILSGKPVFFRMATPWGGAVLDQPPSKRRSSNPLYDALYLLVVVGCLVEARRNLRQGRGDRTGARRLAIYVLTITLLQWLFQANHSAQVATESQLLVTVAGLALYKAILLCWVPYIALEPHIRRRWPEKIVSWTRLLAGRLRDPLLGRDLLIGLAAAVVLQLLLLLPHFLPGWLGYPAPPPATIWPDTLLGPGDYLSAFLDFQEDAVFLGFALLFLLLLADFLSRSGWLAVVLIAGILTVIWYGEVSTLYPSFSLTVTGLRMFGFVLVLKRFGVLASIVAIFFDSFLNTFPITTALSEWYTENSVFALTVVFGLGAYGVYAARTPIAAAPRSS